MHTGCVSQLGQLCALAAAACLPCHLTPWFHALLLLRLLLLLLLLQGGEDGGGAGGAACGAECCGSQPRYPASPHAGVRAPAAGSACSCLPARPPACLPACLTLPQFQPEVPRRLVPSIGSCPSTMQTLNCCPFSSLCCRASAACRGLMSQYLASQHLTPRQAGRLTVPRILSPPPPPSAACLMQGADVSIPGAV